MRGAAEHPHSEQIRGGKDFVECLHGRKRVRNNQLDCFFGRYRRWKLGDDIDLIVRCEHDGVMTGASGEVSFINIKTLNEWDSRVRKNENPKLALPASLLPDTPGTAGKRRPASGSVLRVVTFHRRPLTLLGQRC